MLLNMLYSVREDNYSLDELKLNLIRIVQVPMIASVKVQVGIL
jgi:hypothetical protein